MTWKLENPEPELLSSDTRVDLPLVFCHQDPRGVEQSWKDETSKILSERFEKAFAATDEGARRIELTEAKRELTGRLEKVEREHNAAHEKHLQATAAGDDSPKTAEVMSGLSSVKESLTAKMSVVHRLHRQAAEAAQSKRSEIGKRVKQEFDSAMRAEIHAASQELCKAADGPLTRMAKALFALRHGCDFTSP